MTDVTGGNAAPGSGRAAPLAGTTALVTAGGGAIGSATATLLARDGAHVLIAGRTQSVLEAAADRIGAAAAGGPGTVRWVVADALDPDTVPRLVASAAEPTGRLDAAAGVVGGGGPPARLLDAEPDDVMNVIQRNVLGNFLLIKHAGRAMVAGGGGSIVCVSSMQAHQTAPFLGPYCASKACLEMLCKVAADELGADRVRVNVVRPGLTVTGKETHPSSDDGAMAAYMVEQPIDRPGRPEDIAGAIRYLAGPESTWVTGIGITVDGGTSLRRFPDLTEYWAMRARA